MLIGDGLTTYGSFATQTCNTGYDPTGDTNITCGADGIWNHPVVTCTIKGYLYLRIYCNKYTHITDYSIFRSS